jgi:dihydrofolate reductase
MITLIAAIGRNNVLGGDNRLLWQQKTDLLYFKRQTLHKPLIMGRKTFESLPRALPARLNIVLSHQALCFKNAIVTTQLETALEIAQAKNSAIAQAKNEEVMIIGGAQIYNAFLPLAQRLLLTEIDTSPQGDAYFPEIDQDKWLCLSQTRQSKQEGDEFDMVFKDYRLKAQHNSPIYDR